MKDKQILFMGQMVRAILDGHKGMTRRLPDPRDPDTPYCAVGQRLWVREAHSFSDEIYPVLDRLEPEDRWNVWYRADGNRPAQFETRWRPGIHLPRWACRIELECTAIRREPLSAITVADALAEGFGQPGETEGTVAMRAAFFNSWRKLHGPAFSAPHDPLVWVISFVRVPCRA